MTRDFLQGVRDEYDVAVVGAGLAGMTAANILARAGHRVLLLEHHYRLGGLATWFRRPHGHIFDVSLHGFPAGMLKSCRRYWSPAVADAMMQLKNIRFDNPMFSLGTTFDRQDFTRLLIERFRVEPATVAAFFDAARAMNHFDDRNFSTRQLFDKFFPGRDDVVRLLMEPITFANGSTLEDPALTYGIVFSNFMSKGVFTIQGGTDHFIGLLTEQLRLSGVDARIRASVEKVHVADRRVCGVTVNGRRIRVRAVISNANLLGTIFNLVGPEAFDPAFVDEARSVRLNNSSTQVYLALREGEMIDEDRCGDVLFSSTAPAFRTDLLLSRQITSRAYSFYYPKTRPGRNRCLIVGSTNARYEDWANLPPDEYEASKQALIEETLDSVAKYVPQIRRQLDWAECSTPRSFLRYTRHLDGASFGTKFEGLQVSRGLPQQVRGLYHAGSVGIIMSGWLGTVNYGVIVANEVDALLTSNASQSPTPVEAV